MYNEKRSPAFARTYLNAQMSVTLENQFAISRPISFYQDYGKNVGLAMYQAYVRVANPLPGDFDEDGDVDQGDLAAWQAGLGTADGAQHYQGDANGDGRFDGADFLVWQQQFAAARVCQRSNCFLVGLRYADAASTRQIAPT